MSSVFTKISFLFYFHVCFFSLPLIFTLLATSISHFSPLLLNFHVVLPTNSPRLFFISRSSSLSLCFSLSFSSLSPTTFSLSLSFSFSIFQFCGHDKRIEKNFSFPFCVCLLFNWLFFTRRWWLYDFPPKKLESHLSSHTCWLSYFTLVHLWGGQTGVRSHDYK